MGKKHRGTSRYSRNKRKRKTHSVESVGTLPVGTIEITSQGYGFVQTPEGNFYISKNKINGAMDGDIVRVRPISKSKKRRQKHNEYMSAKSDATRASFALVDKVLERKTQELIGKYVVFEETGYFIPQDARLDYLIRANAPSSIEVCDGDIVILLIDTYPTNKVTPTGEITRIVGREDDPQIIEEIFAARHGIDTCFSKSATSEANDCYLDIKSALDEPDRRDIRDRFILTIDPTDAKDFDDALSLDIVDNTWRLGVHIADVSNYVRWGTSIDLDARKRATSTYFPNRVIPMLPEKLSNDLCSLKPDVDRLTFSVDMYFDSNANCVKTDMYPSVIRSRFRLDYSSVQSMFDRTQKYPSIDAKQTLENLLCISQKLRNKRSSRGALDFESTELKVTFDDDGNPNGIIKRDSCQATELVEECMIAANEAVASYMLTRDSDMVYRVHDEPSLSYLEDIVPALREFGYALYGIPSTNEQIQDILDDAHGKPIYPIISNLLLRAMKQAVYRNYFTTHFGLASLGYTHFTSPIRRYPDLLAHRLLRLQLFKDKYPKNPPARPQAIAGIADMVEQLEYLCENSSAKERDSEKASYDALNSKICEYMEQFVGDKFKAIIINVMQFGFFVRLTNGCEGLVPISELDGWFDFDEAKRKLSYMDSGANVTYRLGQEVDVVLIKTDKLRGNLTFTLA